MLLFLKQLRDRLMKLAANSISIPARISLWLGVVILGVAYYQREVALLVIGGLFVCIGCGLWVMFGNLSTWGDRIENTLYRFLKRTPLKNLQMFYNLEARIEIKRKKYQDILKHQIAQAEKNLQYSKNKSNS